MRKKKRKSVYLLPNLLTSMSLFGGFYSMVATIDQKFVYAAMAIFLSCLCDALDGPVARKTGSASKFGVEYDSLADLVAFGVAPGLLAYMWALKGYGRFGWLAAFLYVACGALRLARFNVQAATVQKRQFLGLPIPMAAMVIASSVLFFSEMGISVEVTKILAPVLVYALAFLMVSAVRYSSTKEMSFLRTRHFEAIVAAILLLVIVLIQPAITLFVIALGYTISGPVLYLFKRKAVPEETPHSAQRTPHVPRSREM
jgi:CDP-diacylglycerol--serine O-phosphatidyltransferase